MEGLWEDGNPPPRVWEAAERVFEGREREGDQMVVFGYRYWHCAWYRLECLKVEEIEMRKGVGRMEVGEGIMRGGIRRCDDGVEGMAEIAEVVEESESESESGSESEEEDCGSMDRVIEAIRRSDLDE